MDRSLALKRLQERAGEDSYLKNCDTKKHRQNVKKVQYREKDATFNKSAVQFKQGKQACRLPKFFLL